MLGDRRFGVQRHAPLPAVAATLVLAATIVLAAIAPAAAEVELKEGTFGGLRVTYRVLLPDDFDPERSYPVVLHFAGGPQTLDIVERSTDADWRAHAEQHQLVVVSPASPNGELFFAGADRIFPELIEHILETYRAVDGKLHATGHSNGGLSAFHVASLYPEHFVSVTGYPGLLRNPSDSRLEALEPLCLYMHVGDRDDGWRSAMEEQYRRLADGGFHVKFAVEEDQGHRLDTAKNGLAERLLAELEEARQGCASE